MALNTGCYFPSPSTARPVTPPHPPPNPYPSPSVAPAPLLPLSTHHQSLLPSPQNDGEQGIHRLSDVAALLPQGVRLYRHNDPRLTVARVVWRKQFNGALEYKGNPKKGGEGAEA